MTTPARSTEVWKTQHQLAHETLAEFPFLYHDWIYPNTLETLRDKDVLDAGSGPGVQIRLMAQVARSITAVDLEALDVSTETTRDLAGKVHYVRDDISKMDLGRQFDVVNCVGVIHHTDDPTVTFRNLARHLKPGGRMIIWAYAREGNFLMANIVEPFRKRVLDKAPHQVIWWLSMAVTAAMWPIVHTIYRLPLRFLPYYEYFDNFRRLSLRRNVLNAYDKLNAPQQHFLSRETMASWFNAGEFCDVHLSQYKGVSWRASGTRRPATR
jgi:2-polyprenyl-3-methyl-5-hydroxy-6-metoxy-1,4-benzoquinol methylase